MKVSEVMTSDPTTCPPGAPLQDVARVMRDQDTGAVPICENGRLLGMVTDRDIVCKGLAGNGFDASRAKARDVMTFGKKRETVCSMHR